MIHSHNYLQLLNNKKVLVTGGLGFVGHNLVKSLLDDYNCDVTIVDNCLNSTPKILGEYLERVNFLEIDALDIASYQEALSQANYVFHLACVQIAASSTNVEYDLNVNALSTLRILEYYKDNSSPNLEKFIYTSSASVYGSSTRLPLNEDAYPMVLSNYAATKLLGENFTLIYGKNYGIPVTTVRYSNVYGDGQSPTNPYCGVLGKFVHNAITGQPLPVIGDGEQTRDYTYISDAVNATLLSGVHPMAVNDVLNIGTGVETSVNKLAELIKEYVQGIEIERLPERNIDNIRRRVVDIEKLHQKTGWTPSVSMKKGLELTLEWYKKYLK